MYKKIKNFFTKNLFWKLASVVMSALLWFIVMNINNPTEIKSFSLPLIVTNLENLENKNISILNKDDIMSTKVELRLKASRPVLDELTKKFIKGEIKATLDTSFTNEVQELTSPIEITSQVKTNLSSIPYPNNNFEIVSFSPTNLNIALDTIITVPKKLYAQKKGTPKNGYIASEPSISSEYIQISGIKSNIEKVNTVVVEVNVSDKTESFIQKVTPVAYDKNGNEVNDINFNLKSINASVIITSQEQIKINEPTLIGEIKKGYYIKNVSFSPRVIKISGNPTILKTINPINLPPINLSNLTETKEFIFNAKDLLKTYASEIEFKENTQISVILEIEKAQEITIKLNSEDIKILNLEDKIVTFPDTFNIKIFGDEKTIEQLNINNLKPTINLKNVETGIKELEINISLPENISLVAQPTIIATIKSSTEVDTTENTSNNEFTETEINN